MTMVEVAPHAAPDPEPVESPIALSSNRYPTGWFQVAWSDEIVPGDKKLLHYFGQDFVIWRGASGQLFGLDPYCLHLGANLGVGSTVDGDDIVCPWHRWKWDGNGRNVSIPYSKQECKPGLQIRRWPVREKYGCIFVWYGGVKELEVWELPTVERLERNDFYPIDDEMRQFHNVKAHPQLIVENGVDPAHVPAIHGAGEMPEITKFGFTDHHWQTQVTASYGAGKNNTWMTPDGMVHVTLTWDLWGIGIGTSEWPEELMSLIMLLTATPVDDTYTHIRMQLTGKRVEGHPEPPRAIRKMIAHQMHVVTQDFFIWEHMQVLHQPNFAPEEARPYAAMRRWARQFYA